MTQAEKELIISLAVQWRRRSEKLQIENRHQVDRQLIAMLGQRSACYDECRDELMAALAELEK